ncbi:hypothetical protein AA0242T_2745 [Acetobacter aceti NRIC 0242]|uniref:DUF1156 domain-containing protein n=1 Tax=Acetobacter aceti NBRC 14818 TaxID=887700 RepID=A0AB33IIV4_ACEAC|nr:DUF1156 domain-containing protein [Acetobacter aceti]TCS31406.1 putative DNA methylase [Acetobacter aceti NBRC 14818]BCK76786.1 hypothetical protein EMQ_2392 [Acetobacter aceti NBRC 14818]GAN56889.1 hypothetical protein Abac_011_016 [Acetobacter aceti NBRC 14818]GBO82043.1 hypothetical protein AA0242T_2745 [Acetobacter aceti NRIC 0242]
MSTSTRPNPTIRRKLIEVSLPLDDIGAASKKQKAPKGYPTSLHKYWAQRPLAACRAVLFAQLVDDPSAWPDRFPTEEAQEAERNRLHDVIRAMVPWEASGNETILNAARWEIARSVAWNIGEEAPPREDGEAILRYLQEKAPPVYDPFSGGGSIPLEAQRLGLRAYGSDLNPVAVLIGKALVEIPPKFVGQAPVNPDARAEAARGGAWQGRGAQGLAEDVRYYGKWMRDEAEKRIGHLYPKATLPDGSEATIIAWLWARTVRSPDPAAKGAMVPMVSSFMLSTKAGKKAWAEIVHDATAPDGWRFEVRTGDLSAKDEARLKKGTIGRSGGGVCALTGSAMPFSYIRQQGKGAGLSNRLMAIVAEGKKGRIYLSPTADQVAIADRAQPQWVPDGELPNNPRDFKTPNYGLKTFASLFTPRQLVALTTFSDLVAEAREKVLQDAVAAGRSTDSTPLHEGGIGATAYADAVATYLGFMVDRASDYGSEISTWLTDDNAIRGTFGRQAIPMTWDFCEANYFGKSSADLNTISKVISEVVFGLPANSDSFVFQRDISSKEGYKKSYIINTDPPYYDNIGYADLSDFFYVWMKKSLQDVWPELFRRLSTPKGSELIATPYRHSGSKEKAEKFFMQGMKSALVSMRDAALQTEPLVIYYAFKQSEVAKEGTTSAGWASFLQGICDSGLMIDGTWPVRTESSGRLIGKGSNALASSIVLVCRSRPETSETVTRSDFLRTLRRELPAARERLRVDGVSPVDMPQSIIGPGMGVFTRYASVLEDDDSVMSVRTALTLINRVWEEIENALDAEFDPETQVALAWYASHGFDTRPSGELITLANAKNISLSSLFQSEVFLDRRGKAQLTPRENLPAGWSPQTDGTLTVWECVQHVARTLEATEGGQEAAARLVAGMGGKTEAARALAYRLFQIATDKGWPAEALVYNALAEEWPTLERLASEIPDPVASPVAEETPRLL